MQPFTFEMGRRSSLLDLSPINDAIDFAGRTNQQNIANRRADEALQLQKNQDQRAQSSMDEDMRRKRIGDIGRLAQAALDEQDPTKRLANAQRLMSIPGVGDRFKQEGIDVSDPIQAAQHISALAGTYMRNAELEKEKLGIQVLRRQANAPMPDQSKLVETNDGNVVRVSPGKQGEVVYRGGVKPQTMDATTKKAIQEADDFVAQNRTAVDLIDRAITLNDKANAGAGAGFRAGLANNLPDALVPDFVSSPESGQATTELDNLVTSQALQSLRSTFGANPTEGERQILMEVAGSVNMPRAARKGIYERAKAAANERMTRSAERADAMRRGTYYSPGFQPSKPQSNLSNTQNTPAAAARQQAEAQKVVNGKTYLKIGGQWYDSGN